MSIAEFDKTVKALRPSVLPDNKKLFFYPVIIGAGISLAGIIFGNIVMVALPLIILAVFPGLPIFFHSIFHLSVKIELQPEKLVVTDYAGDRFVKFKRRQEITYDDICYVYYLGKEISLLLNLRKKLKKYKLPAKETDYTKGNLVDRYGVPDELMQQFKESTQKALTDFTGTAVIMTIDEICQKYNIPKETTKSIKRALKNDSNLNFEYLEKALKDHPISSEDMIELKDEFTNVNADILAPFLMTKVNLNKYTKTEKLRHGTLATVRADIGLVLSNKDGNQKVYLMHFHDLSDKDLLSFIDIINRRNPNIRYLMTQKEINRLTGR